MGDNDPVTGNHTGTGKTPSATGVPSKLPELIGRYRIRRLLGQGRSGVVYLGHDEHIDQPVAVKVPLAELVSQPADSEAYLAEARTVANLDHPHIVPVQEVGSDDKFSCFIVSNYIPGVDLKRYSLAEHHDPFEGAKIMVMLAGALDHAHGRNLCHLNLRPGKILVDSERKPWLFADDFMRVDRLAGDGWIPGNPYYFSPEQVAGEEVGLASDIYSLGVVFYTILTGQGPYQSEGGLQLCEEILTPSVRPPSRVDAHIPPEFDRICARAMARSPEKRYQSLKELANELRAIIT